MLNEPATSRYVPENTAPRQKILARRIRDWGGWHPPEGPTDAVRKTFRKDLTGADSAGRRLRALDLLTAPGRRLRSTGECREHGRPLLGQHLPHRFKPSIGLLPRSLHSFLLFGFVVESKTTVRLSGTMQTSVYVTDI